MSVLVTGANGFLGSHLVKALCQNGQDVFAFVRRSSDLSHLKGVDAPIVYGDITDKTSLLEPFSRVSTVFHAAGLVTNKSSDYETLEKVNVEGVFNVVSACVETKIKKLIHVSSVAAIGASFKAHQLLNEESPRESSLLKLKNFEFKRRGEEIVLHAVRENGLQAVIVNPSLIFGAGDAKKPIRKGNIQVAKGQQPFYTEGGVNIVAVENVVDGMLKAWEKGRSGERYILGGENISIQQFLALIAASANVKAPHIKLPKFLLQPLSFLGGSTRENITAATLYHWFDSSKAEKELGYQTSSAKVAIENSVQWMKHQGLLD